MGASADQSHICRRNRRSAAAARAVCSGLCLSRECSWCAAARLTSCASPALPVVPPPDTRRSPAPGCRVGALTPPRVPRVGVTAARPVRKDPRAHRAARPPQPSADHAARSTTTHRVCAIRPPAPRPRRRRRGPRRRAARGPDAARPGPVGAGPPRAAERQRADEEGRRRPARAGSGSRTATATPASTASTPATCAAGSAGGGCTRSARPASTAAAPRSWSRRSSRTSTS